MTRFLLLVLCLVSVLLPRTVDAQGSGTFPNYTWTNPSGVIVKGDFNTLAGEVQLMQQRASGRSVLASRPAASTSNSRMLWIVTNCNDATCSSTGTMECLMRVNDAGSAWDVGPCEAGGGGGFTGLTLAGDGGTPQSIADGNTITVSGGTGLTCNAGATDKVTCDLDSPVAVTAGGTGLSASVEDAVIVGSGTTTWQTKTLPLSTGAGQCLQYDTTGNTFSAHTLV